MLALPLIELQILVEYASKYPPGWRTEIAIAANTTILANANRDTKKKSSPFKMAEFSSVYARLSKESDEKNKQQRLINWLNTNAESDGDKSDTEADSIGDAGAGTFGCDQGSD